MRKTTSTKRYWLAAVLIFSTAIFLLSQSEEVFGAGWVKRLSEPGIGVDAPGAAAIDATGNIYITGSSNGIFANSNSLITTVKHNKSGKQLWARYFTLEQMAAQQYTGAATAIALDMSGNAYIAGYFGDTSKNKYTFIVIKYNPNGREEWMGQYKTADKGFQSATGVALDSEGSVYLTGVVPGAGGTTMTDWATVKYDAAGKEKWAKIYNGPGNGQDYPTAIAVDQFNSRICVTGYSRGFTGGVSDYTTVQYDSNGDQKWVRRYNGPGNKSDQANAIAIGSDGAIYVTGQSVGATSSYDYATVKYDTYGTQKWVKRYNGPGSGYDVAAAIGVDSSNNAYVTGYSVGSGTQYDYATLKYDPAGTQVWVNRYNGDANGYDLAGALVVDRSDGSVYVTGTSRKTAADSDYVTVKYSVAGVQYWVMAWGGVKNLVDSPAAIALDSTDGSVCVAGKSKSPTTSDDFATVKYAKGGAQLWSKLFNMPGGISRAGFMAVDGAGNVHVTGITYSPKSYIDWLTVKYGAGGAKLWAKRGSGPGFLLDMPAAITLDDDGNVYLAGAWMGFGTRRDYAVAKYDPSGEILWAKRYDGPAHRDDEALAIVVDAQKNVYVTGYSQGTNDNADFATLKYDVAGNPVWVQRYNGAANANDKAVAIAIDSEGSIYVTGRSDALTSSSAFVTVKYGANGAKKWEAQYDGPVPGGGYNQPVGIAVDSTKNVYVAGKVYDPASGYDYAAVKYDVNGNQKWVKRYDGPDKLDDIPNAMVLDSANNLYVTGGSKTSSSSSEFATVKYDTNGVKKWVGRLSGAAKGEDAALAIAADNAGNIYVTGYSWGTVTKNDFLTAMYDAAGLEKWTKRYDRAIGGGDDVPVAIGVDSAKNVYVTGTSDNVNGLSEYTTIKYPAQ
jgi:uncharacterized delta-60 repeat protein